MRLGITVPGEDELSLPRLLRIWLDETGPSFLMVSCRSDNRQPVDGCSVAVGHSFERLYRGSMLPMPGSSR